MLRAQEHYVEIFDRRRKACLYLTYFLNGDTRGRGMALVGFKEAYQAFVAAYCVARNRLRAGAKDVVFPDGSFPSPMPFVRAAPA